MANGGQDRVVEADRESKTNRKWEAGQPGQSPQAAAESEAEQRAEQRSRDARRSRKLTRTRIATSTHDSTTSNFSLLSHTISPSVIHVLYHHPPVSSQRRHLPSASPWRRILLFVLPASSSCTTHPRRQPVLERRFVQPLLQLIIIIASVNRLVRSLRREFKNTPSTQTSAHVSRTFLDLSTARSLSSLQPSYLPSTRSRTPSPRRGTCDRFTHAKQVLKGRTSRTGAQA